MRNPMMVQYGMRGLDHFKAGMKSRQKIRVQVICVANNLNVTYYSRSGDPISLKKRKGH